MNKQPPLTLIARSAQRLPCPAETVRAALSVLIKSRHFAKAFRCTTLLSYLVERALEGGDAAPPPEHEVGVAVFGRDPDCYFPGDDPIVRVQAGRLRLRLAAYYEEEGAADPLRISVPAGRYQAMIALAEARPPAAAEKSELSLLVRPLVCPDPEARVASFAAGLGAELECRLYSELKRENAPLRLTSPVSGMPQRPSHTIEGTVRQDAARLRVSLQLRDGEAGTLLWCAQFDTEGGVSIDGQEKLAERCVHALMPHLPRRQASVASATPAGNGNDTIERPAVSLM